ncbi:MAG: helix-turn-helix domain-containing protein [Oscillospiraceae bacterium]|jgi:hypothetical protein|nr:helix-turn-helix domain-containing protein [Oscillospiraceae bacterium]
MTKKTISNHSLPPFETIEAAASGDVCAINAILRHYNGYILSLSSRLCFDPYGNVHKVVDPEMKRRLETKLLTRILKFRVA